MSKTSKADLTTNILLSLAWLGELDKHQIQRLCLSQRSIQTVENTLRALRKDGLVEPRAWHINVAGIPHEQPSLWSLTKPGHALIAGHDQYPPKPAAVGPKRLIGHDYRTNQAIIRLVELARDSDISGIYVQFEVRLDPEQPRPRMDALVIMQTGGGYGRTDLVPWSKDPAIEDEARWRFAIESDSDTEPIAVIEGKARAYRAVHRDPSWRDWWCRQWGPQPYIIWVVPDRPRLDGVQAAWQRVWPTGGWMLTTVKGLALNQWLVYANNETRSGTISGFPNPRPTPQPSAPRPLPAPAAAPIAPVSPPAVQSRPAPMAAAPPAPPTGASAPPAGATPAPPAAEPAVARVPAHPGPVPTMPPAAAERPPERVIRVMPMLPPPRPLGPPFQRPVGWQTEHEEFLWMFAVKSALSALFLSIIIAILPFVADGLWAARATLLWIVAGVTLIGLVWWKHDTWWLGEEDTGRLVNRGTVLLGLTLLVLPTGFGRWSWATFGPVPDTGMSLAGPIIVSTEVTLVEPTPVPVPTPALVPTPSTTPATCGEAVVNAPAGLRLRDNAGTEAAILRKLPHGTVVELLCDVRDREAITWAHVRVGGIEGWVAQTQGNSRYLVQP